MPNASAPKKVLAEHRLATGGMGFVAVGTLVLAGVTAWLAKRTREVATNAEQQCA